jgi:HPt (histidine-containing phosphotransfer) domain-containing protein
MLEMLSRQAETQLTLISQALQAQNAKELAFAAHSLKGAAATLGADRVSAAAARLEIMGRTDNLASASPALGQLEQELQRLQAEIVIWKTT